MTPLQTLLILFFAVLFLYTIFTVGNEGANFFPGFIAGLLSFTWEGQIYLDFSLYLILSGLWVAWRGGFSAGACVLGAVLVVLAMLGFALYLLYVLRQTKGDMRALLLGVHAEQR